MSALPFLAVGVSVVLHAATVHAGAPPATATEAGDVVVHMSSDSDAVRLVRIGADGAETVCTAPCDKPLPASGTYRIVGDGMPSTSLFTIQPANGHLTLDIQAGSSVQRLVGIGSVFAGATALIFSAVYTEGLLLEDAAAETRRDHYKDPLLWGSFGGGLVLAIAGGILMATASTWVQTSNGVSFGMGSGTHARARRPRVTLTPAGLHF
jgi:hypothetical protein